MPRFFGSLFLRFRMGKYSNLTKAHENVTNEVKFEFVKGKYTGGEFSIHNGQTLTIGRDISSDVAIVDSKVSRNHASIIAYNGKVVIVDHNSTNGTFVNDEKITPSTEIELSAGSRIAIGDSIILVDHNAPGLKKNAQASQSSPDVAPAPDLGVEIETDSDSEDSFNAPGLDAVIEAALKPVDYKNPDAIKIKLTKSINEIKNECAPEEPEEDILDTDSILEEISDEDGVEPLTLKDAEKPGTDAVVVPAAAAGNPEKVQIGKLNLKRAGKADIEKDVLANIKTSTSGDLSTIDVTDLIQMLIQSASSGVLTIKTTSPFKNDTEIVISAKGMVACRDLTNPNFSPEKALSRVLLANTGEYFFKVDPATKNDAPNRSLTELFEGSSEQINDLMKWRKISSHNKLELRLPMKGKLSSLNKTELDTLQFMLEAKSVLNYLNSLADIDDFMLFAEIVKYIDHGILDNSFDNGSGDIF